MKKRIISKIPLATMGVISSLGLGVVVGQVVDIATIEKSLLTQTRQGTSSEFVSTPPRNNKISNLGNVNYQFQDQVSSADVNNPELYNRNNVLSDQTILTVRSENYYFNFIKSTLVSDNDQYHIVSTPVDPNSQVLPQVFKELEITLLNGSALWLNDRLIIAGQVNSARFDLIALSLDDKTGILSEENRITSSPAAYSSLFHLSSSQMVEHGPPQGIGLTDTSWIPKSVSANPVYLSPVTNFYNPSPTSSEFLAWSAGMSFGGTSGFLGGTSRQISSPTPIIITYDHQRFTINELKGQAIPMDTPMPSPINNSPINPIAAMNASIIKAITPIKLINGNLVLIVHSLGSLSGTGDTGAANVFVSKIIASETEWIYQESLDGINGTAPDSLPERYILPSLTPNRTTAGRDLTAVMPYGLVARGDAKNPTENSNTINLFWLLTPDSLVASPAMLMSVQISSDGKTISVNLGQNFAAYEPNGSIFTNFFDVEQVTYGTGGNMEGGMFIGVRYRGVTIFRTATRSGVIRYQKPWDDNFWSANVLFSGTQILDGYISDPNMVSYEIPLQLTSDVMPTIHNGIMSTPGIYEVQNRNLNDPNAPLTPTKRVGVTTTTKDLNNGSKNPYNTSIPQYIVLQTDSNIDPLFLGNLGISNIIEQHAVDIPALFSEIIIDEITYLKSSDLNASTLKLELSLVNPYVNGQQFLENNSVNFSTTILTSPTQGQIDNPILSNNTSSKLQVPSDVLFGLEQAFLNGFNPSPGIIGIGNENLVQIPTQIVPFISNFEIQVDDFLGTMQINYTLQPGSIGSLPINGTLTINGFFGLVYIIPIVLGSIILIGGIIAIIFFSLKKKHLENVKESILTGFKIFETKKENKKTDFQKRPGTPIMMAPNNVFNKTNLTGSSNTTKMPPLNQTKVMPKSNKTNSFKSPEIPPPRLHK